MTVDQFCSDYPSLYHMATADALHQIKKYGLLSTQATLDLLGVMGEQREVLTSRRRSKSVALAHAEHGRFVLRDQIPMRDATLERCLEGMTISEWYRMLNERVFMWASYKRVETLLGARAYRGKDHLILTIDSRKLAADHGAGLRMSAINSGATLYNPPRRGASTFCALSDYECVNGKKPIVEVTVVGSIPRIKDYISDAVITRSVA